MEPAGMAFEHIIRVGWGDCDPARIAYTARLPAFALEAIDAWWEHHLGGGWYQMELDHGFGTPFVSMQLDFVGPVTPRHRLVCAVAPTRLGTTSIGFRVTGRQDGRDCFRGRFTCVFTRPAAQGAELLKSPPPAHVRALVERYLEPETTAG
jgi:4-hydroxybenzoyl-CoA thioesterase